MVVLTFSSAQINNTPGGLMFILLLNAMNAPTNSACLSFAVASDNVNPCIFYPIPSVSLRRGRGVGDEEDS